ncbi:TonB-dependent receptor domain-containing protein [Hydrogenophilus thiooxidans]|uniref:TonB-dependent receptor domain-containing protein n=1 Tax=Hydrogenophilus thiooxidans TaxID=2820326 RepID=UPI001C229242|nr:TonB-dependent receptor [Hydrogenophilus thiooxidans]
MSVTALARPRKGQFLLLTLGSLFTPLAVAQMSAFDPTLPTIAVTASRTPTRTDASLSAVTVLTRDAIEHSGARTLVDLLNQTPGVRIAQNGGPGASASLFLRGAEARHTLVLIDGMRIGSATLGTATLEAIPLETIERIEIVRGPASALYGSDAIGGVIQIFTRKGTEAPHRRAFVGVGSHEQYLTSVGASGGTTRFRYALDLGGEGTQGIDATTPANSNHQPDRDGWRNRFASAHLAWSLANGGEIALASFATRGRNEYDAWGSGTYNALLHKDLTSNQVTAHLPLTKEWLSTLRVGETRDTSKALASASSMSRFATAQRQLSWQNEVALPLGVLLAAFDLTATEVDATTRYTRTSRTVRGYLLGWQAEEGPHGWQLTTRYDDNTQFGGKTTGQAAYRYQFTPQWQGRVAASSAFKAPTFNQLYWPDTGFGGGNPNLKPETAYEKEVGIRWQRGVTAAELTLFDARVKNLIAGWPPENVARARIKGAELTLSNRFDAWTLRVNADWLTATDEATGKRLPRRAPAALSAALLYDAKRWQAGIDLNAQRARWDNVANTTRLDGYGRTDLWWHYALTRSWRLEAEVRNLFAQTYETAATYRQPGRTFFVGLRYRD